MTGSQIHIDKSCIFRETFQGAASIAQNGGTINNVIIVNNSAKFNGNANIRYSRIDKKCPGITFRIRIKNDTPVNIISHTYFIDTRTIGRLNGSYLYYYRVSNKLETPLLATYYVNGQAWANNAGDFVNLMQTTQIFELVVTIASAQRCFKPMIGSAYNGINFLKSTLELVEIYNRPLTAQEVRLLYSQSAYSPLRLKSFFDLSFKTGVIKDMAANRAISATNIVVANKGGYKAYFNSSTNKIDTGSDIVGTKPVTVAAWIYLHRVNFNRIVDNLKFKFYISATQLAFQSDGATNALSASGVIVKQRWIHVVVTRNSEGKATFFVNGFLSGIRNQNSGVVQAGTGNITIGLSPTGNNGPFYGYMGGVKFFDGVLDDIAIVQLYYSEKPLYL